MSDLVSRLRDMAENKALPIGEAWNALDEAADALEALEADAKLNAAMLARQCDLARQAEQERDAAVLALDPIAKAYSRFRHLDDLFEMIRDSDGTEQTDPFRMTARDLWRAIKASIGARVTP